MLALRERFSQAEAFRALPEAVAGKPIPLSGLAGSSKALLAAALREANEQVLFVCCADDIEVEEWVEDLSLFSPPSELPPPLVLPELARDEDLRPLPGSLRARASVLHDLRPRTVVLAEMSALLAPIASAAEPADQLELSPGRRMEPSALHDQLKAADLRRVPHVAEGSEWAARGDVVDVFPEGHETPVRIEFFDDEIESIRRFDPTDQSSTVPLDEVVLTLPRRPQPGATTSEAFPLDLCDPERTLILVVEPVRFEEQLSRFTLREGTLSLPVAAFQNALTRFPAYSLSTLPVGDGHDLGCETLSLGPPEGWDLKGRIIAASKLLERPLVVLRSAPEVKRLERLAHEAIESGVGIDATFGHLARGFRIPRIKRCLLNHGEFFGTGIARRRYLGKKRRAPVESRVLGSFFELAPGDWVVHAVHGIAKFIGLERTKRGTTGGDEDHLRLCFANDVEVLVPASKIDLVQKYIGGGGDVTPKPDKLGSKAFSRRKAQVQSALHDTAAELLDLQVRRQQQQGFACPANDDLYDEFEHAFPFEDTADQEKSTVEILRDLTSPRPMDRLLCGDVGFGKTELAMRAAFRMVSAGKQVAMLVPTTLLCDQHGRTFRDRFASFPVHIEVLSRFQNAREKKDILALAASGGLDILIGTHQLLGKDVAFQDLGLLLIDEEQRFGVAHKEKIRSLRASVDVMTLTATPIPRTLHMSLLGLRDISSLATPPAGRLEIATQIVNRQASLIRSAILTELARGGQVFFLHNRVHDIERVRVELAGIVPEARIVVGHGQMSKRELLDAMHSFLKGEADVLLSTTIVESGIDIPRANTILVDNSHMFGLADLHQLRGRVGRDVHKAHCYLLIDPAHPMTEEARRRLQAMKRFSGLGAGFQVAMRDLEIRGAGNLLGREQSGHIAAIGYDMYCRLLQAAVERNTNPHRAPEPPEAAVAGEVDIGVEAFIPEGIVDDARLRLALLRELDEAADRESYQRVCASLRDRFGRLPDPLANLVSLFVIKHQLGSRGMHVARWVPPDQIMLSHATGHGPHGAWLEAFADVRPIAPNRTCLVLPPKTRKPEQVLRVLQDALIGRQRATKMSNR